MKVKFVYDGATIVAEMNKNTQVYPHFKLWELANNKGNPADPQFEFNQDQDDLMVMIEELRVWWGKSMTCNSCFRQPAYNKSVKGASNSLHLHSLAFDWGVSLTSSQYDTIINKWKEICNRHEKIGGINLYKWGVHLDANEEKFGKLKFTIRDYR